MATAIALGFSVGDSVSVAYPFPSSNYFAPVTAVVTQIKFTAAGDVALVSFASGADVQHSTAAPTCYTTIPLAAAAIVDNVIVRVDATVNLDTGTLSGASTAGATALSLVRSNA